MCKRVRIGKQNNKGAQLTHECYSHRFSHLPTVVPSVTETNGDISETCSTHLGDEEKHFSSLRDVSGIRLSRLAACFIYSGLHDGFDTMNVGSSTNYQN